MVNATPDIFTMLASGDLDALRHVLGERPVLAAARDANGRSAVLFARYRSLDEALALLLAAAPDLDIFEAAAVGDLPQVQARLAADPSLLDAHAPDGFWPLGLAAFFGHAEVARWLLGQGAAVDTVARNPMQVMALHAAVAGRHAEIIRLLLDRGAPANARQQAGCTPLHAAAQHGDAALAELLLAHGADRTLTDDDGRTPADMAEASGHVEIAARLRV